MSQLTQSDIARQVGVSRKAVACALSADPRLHRKLSTRTRERILQTIDQLGYVPHSAARRLAMARTPTSDASATRARKLDVVGLIFISPSEMDGVCHAMMSGAEQVLSQHRASLLFVRVSHADDWSKVDRLTRACGVDAWLVYGAADDAVVDRMTNNGLPFVIIGDHACARTTPWIVDIDHAATARLAVTHLASLGHRRIAFFGGGVRYEYERKTLAAFREVLRELGLDTDERLVSPGALWDRWSHGKPFSAPHNLALFHQWLLSSAGAPTAVFTPEIHWADAIHQALQRLQIDVPRHISLVGYEPAGSMTHGGFTRIELPVAEVGRRGAALLNRISAEGAGVADDVVQAGQPRLVEVAPTLVQGWSCGAPDISADGRGQIEERSL